MINPFVLDKEKYVRSIDPVGQYIKQATSYLSSMTGKDSAKIKQFIESVLKEDKKYNIVDPKISFLERHENGDRVSDNGTLMGYIGDSLKKKELIAPTFTTYTDPEVKESLLVSYVEDNVKARGVAKKAMFVAQAAKDELTAAIKNIEQTNQKLSNNAVSGAHVSASTPIFNKTAHSTLTSTCRSTSGYGNANNEKFLVGNRHYWSPEILINNIVSITTNFDEQKLINICNKYNLKNITIQDVMDCITYSTDLYWSSKAVLQRVRNQVEKLTPLQRQAFIYIGDFYHLRLYNQDLVRKIISRLSSKVTSTDFTDEKDLISFIHKAPEDYVNLAHQICSKEMRGKGKDYKSMLGTNELITLCSTIKNIIDVLNEYSDLISGLWVTDNVPASMAYFPESIRRSALTSDTDSTIFTVQDWVEWYKGRVAFDEESVSVASTMIFLASQTITHVLAKMSANFGFVTKRLNQVAMKNEFYFNVFTPTNVAKHYYATIGCQEGNVFEKLGKEIKGVHLKSSNSPLKIVKAATEMMENIMQTVMQEKKISIVEILTKVADIERTISASIKAGEMDYFRLAQVKPANSYTTTERSSPYGYHLLWKEVFADKYGFIAEPAYSCIKISTILDNPTSTKKWLDGIKDKELATRMSRWFDLNNRKVLPTILLSQEVIRSKGMPEELVDIIDVRTMVSDLSKIFYLITETLGVYVLNDKKSRLLMDEY